MSGYIENIRFKQLFNLSVEEFEDYHNKLKLLKPKPYIGKNKAKDIQIMTFSEVSELKGRIASSEIKDIIYIFGKVFNLKRRKVLRLRVIEFYHALNWLVEEFKLIAEREKNYLSSKPDEKLKSAGLADLDKFGELNTLIPIAEKFGITPQDVENWEYGLVFALQWYAKTTAEINKKYTKSLSE